jgi:AcrR family transcriptional regulator
MKKNTQSKDCKNYHHGDLRNALIIAAAELIEEKGSLDFAMVDAARRANVSSAAPYRHFEDKDALLRAVSEVAFLALDEVAHQAMSLAPYGSSACLIAHQAFYDLMWGDLGLRKRNIAAIELQTSGFNLLVGCVKAWCEQAGLTHYDPLELAVKFWAMAHGLACLTMNDNIRHIMPSADVFSLFESSAITFLDGLRPS